MLKDVTSGVTRLLAGRRRKRVNLALQGGGAHGAFTWGVLDHLLDDGRIEIAGISGTSAGAVNAVMLADGLARGGKQVARERLAAFWRAASLGGHLPGAQRAVVDRLLSLFPFNASPMQMVVDAMARYLSPYDVNPLNINPLKGLIERFADFETIRNAAGPDLFICATNVHSGRLRVFTRGEITGDVVMASAALPLLFRAVEIEGEPYWDGGFTGNPAIIPLIEANDVDDVLVVQISPLARESTPTSVRDILHRMNEITFNASLDSELRALEFIGRSARGRGKAHGGAAPRIKVHRIVMEGVGRKLGAGSRLNTDYDFFALLHRAGKRAARRFLEQHYRDIGRRSTMDLTEVAASA
ncbi:MAG: patatin-like phospholipase family protein [Pseudorhodoplanes sp.]